LLGLGPDDSRFYSRYLEYLESGVHLPEALLE
jgi:hypothetical protein